MGSAREYDDQYVQELIDGLKAKNSENAFHSLIEHDSAVIPYLQSAFRRETDADVAASIMEAIWQFREPSTVPFFAEALNDLRVAVWRAALDGLVVIASPDAIAVLEKALPNGCTHRRDGFRDWVQEALEQAKRAASDQEA